MSQLSLKGVLAKLLDNKAMIDRFYPVGTMYISVNKDFNPNNSWGGTWVLEDAGRFLESTKTATQLNTTVAAGLPNITGQAVTAHSSGTCYFNVTNASGAFYSGNTVNNNGKPAINSTFSGHNMLYMNASRSSSIYGNSTTVQPPAKYVYMWRRTA